MKKRNSISIIVPVYNTQDYLKRCIESIVRQTVKPDEVWLVDDGSTDRSLDICKKYENEYGFIHVKSGKHRGLVAARKIGIVASTSEYIMFSDSDDYIELNALERMKELLDEHEPELITSPFIKEFPSGTSALRREVLKNGVYNRESINEKLRWIVDNKPFFTPLVNFSLCSKVIKKEVLERFQEYVSDEVAYGEASAVMLPLSLAVESMYVSDEAYYHYVVRNDSMSWTPSENRYNEIVFLAQSIINSIGRGGIEIDNDVNRYVEYTIYEALLDNLACVPLGYFDMMDEFPFWDGINRGGRIVVYGKGLFAKGVIDVVSKTGFCEIIANIDSSDVDSFLNKTSTDSYDRIMIAIADPGIVGEIRGLLFEKGIEKSKITTINKNKMTIDALPKEIKHWFINWTGADV